MTEADMLYFLTWLVDYTKDGTFSAGERLATIRREAQSSLDDITKAREREEAERERKGQRLIF